MYIYDLLIFGDEYSNINYIVCSNLNRIIKIKYDL